MAPIVLWRYEIRRAGWAALVTPPAFAGLIALLGGLQAAGPDNGVLAARTLHAVLEQGIPLAAGTVAGALIGRDPAAELQLTLPREYRNTLLRRLIVTFGWAAVVAVATTVALTVSGWWHRWPLAHAPLPGQLTWLAPAVCLAGLGFFSGAVLRSPAAAGGVVAGVWLGNQVLANSMVGHALTRSLNLFATTRGDGRDWLTNRLVLLVVGVVLVTGALAVLARTERLVRGQDA